MNLLLWIVDNLFEQFPLASKYGAYSIIFEQIQNSCLLDPTLNSKLSNFKGF